MTNAFDTSGATWKKSSGAKVSSDTPNQYLTRTSKTKIELTTLMLIIGALSFAVWNFVVRASVLSYGAPGSVYFVPAVAHPGDNVQMHFTDVTWYRACPSKLYMYFQPENGARIDVPVHEVSYPRETGKLPPKWRPFKVPELTPAGRGAVSGHLSSSCWPFEGFPIITSLPSVPLEIVRR